MTRSPALGLGLVLAAAAAGATQPPDWGLSDDGAYVLDARARVAWPRCVEGMRWTGSTCIGTPQLVTRDEAMALAREASRRRGQQWQLPRATELSGLVRRTTRPPGLDPVLFPAAPGGWHWSATASIDTARINQYDYGNIARGLDERDANHLHFLHGWAVNLSTGEARGDMPRRTKLPVRLMLPLD
jgi:hypothetical protein